jgi:hypothetical protein
MTTNSAGNKVSKTHCTQDLGVVLEFCNKLCVIRHNELAYVLYTNIYLCSDEYIAYIWSKFDFKI